MKIDSVGMPVPDDLPDRLSEAWWCPDCSTATWPITTADGALHARRCVPCQAIGDLAAVEVARIAHHPEGA